MFGSSSTTRTRGDTDFDMDLSGYTNAVTGPFRPRRFVTFDYKQLRGLTRCRQRLDGADDMGRRDAEPIQQFLGLAATRDLADRETVDGKAGVGHRRRNGVADAAGCVVIFHGDQAAASRAACRNQSVAV